MMCEIPDNYICIDDVIDELEIYKSTIEIMAEKLTEDIDKTIRRLRLEDEDEGFESLRKFEVSEKLENTVQETLDNLKGQKC